MFFKKDLFKLERENDFPLPLYTENNDFDNVNQGEEDIDSIIYIGGYIVKKIDLDNCCLNLFKVNQCESNYINDLNRGKLTYPSIELVELLSACLKYFNKNIKSNLEKMEKENVNHREFIIKHFMELISNDEALSIFECEFCKALKKSLQILTNIILNNFQKMINDEIENEKNIRKIAKLNE